MKVLGREKITEFIIKHPKGKSSIESWHSEAMNAIWKNGHDIKKRIPSASIIKKYCVIFNINGNRFRLVTKISFETGIVLITWIGTHADYTKMKFP